ncbi:MAG: hypothetical protein RMJ31_04810 [Nitrososphaerota archaeon]|nr:hypothetical protein [Nitrososphaerales archaeon]MCX8191500.1 hypothetical protein [Nitrososphaerales archaeon]MDW8045076.1 hypothetical protein [Nitrososphaerota archaeon]
MPHEGPSPEGLCWPRCVWFKCGKRALLIRGNTIWCSWINESCIGPSCSYALCIRAKMLPQNRCGLVVKRVTTDKVRPEDFKLDIKIPGKLAQRIGSDEDLV